MEDAHLLSTDFVIFYYTYMYMYTIAVDYTSVISSIVTSIVGNKMFLASAVYISLKLMNTITAIDFNLYNIPIAVSTNIK